MADESDPEPTRLVVLDRFLDWGQAQVVRGYLESKGIDCFLADIHAGVFDGSVMIGGFRLMVPADEEQDARRLIAEINPAKPSDPDKEKCPNCASTEVMGQRRPVWGYFGTIFGLIASGGAFERPGEYGMRKCHSCGYGWRRPEG